MGLTHQQREQSERNGFGESNQTSGVMRVSVRLLAAFSFLYFISPAVLLSYPEDDPGI